MSQAFPSKFANLEFVYYFCEFSTWKYLMFGTKKFIGRFSVCDGAVLFLQAKWSTGC